MVIFQYKSLGYSHYSRHISNSKSKSSFPLKKSKGFTLIEIMIVLAIIGLIIAIAVPAWIRAREVARARGCAENLSKIDGAVEQYALDYQLSNGDTTIEDDWTAIVGPDRYIKRTPECPADGVYSFGVVGEEPTCSYFDIQPDFLPKGVNHALQNEPGS